MQGKTGPMSSNVKGVLKGAAEIAALSILVDEELEDKGLGRSLLKLMALVISLEDPAAESIVLTSISDNPLAMKPRAIVEIVNEMLPALTIHLL